MANPTNFSKRLTADDVARRAGLSRATVTAALRDDHRIAIKTRERVRRIAQKMGYVKNIMASALATRKTEPVHTLRVAIITDSTSDHGGFTREHATRTRLAELGYQSDFFNLGSGKISAAKLRKMLYLQGYCGVIFSEIRNETSKIFSVDWSPFSLIAEGRTYYRQKCDSVRDNPYDTVTVTWQAVRQAGYKRIGFLLCRHNPRMLDDHEREASLFSCQQELTAQESAIPPYLGPHWDPSQIQKWLHHHRPDAVVGFNVSHYYLLLEIGLKIPQDVAYANLLGNQDPDQAGSHGSGGPAVKIKTAEHLDSLIRYKKTGFPENPWELVVTSSWHPGASLPVLSAKP